jgi:hypothetical protein
MEAQVGGFDITMSGDGETLSREWVTGLEVTLHFEILYQFEKFGEKIYL